MGVADTDGGAILHPGNARFAVERFAPSDHVGRFVDHYWLVRWDLDDVDGHRQRVLSHPVVNLSVGAEACRVVGPSTAVLERHLTGKGWTFGVMFRPGGFWPFVRRPLSHLAGKDLDVADVLPEATLLLTDAGRRAMREGARGMDDAIATLVPSATQPSERTTQLAELARSDRGIVRSEQLAEVEGVSVRTLQRQFSMHVGLSPKKLIQRYRLQELADHARPDVDWASIAAELGYADQSHLIRDFRTVIGETPGDYSRAAGSALTT